MKIQITDSEALRKAQGWYGGANDPLYAIMSRDGKDIPEAVVEEAVSNLTGDLRRVVKLSKNDPYVKRYGKGGKHYQFGRGLFTKAEIDELKYLRDALAQALKQARGQPTAAHDPTLRKVIVDAMARAFFVDAWARNEEEKPSFHERGYGGHGHGQGVVLMNVAPRTSPAANKAAKEFASEVEEANGRSLPALYQTAVAQEGHKKVPNPSDFGYYLAMEGMGHGVGWFDDHPEFPLSVPDYEFNI